MAKLIKWFQGTADRLLDPQRKERISSAAREINTRLFALRDAFDVKNVLAEFELFDRDAVESLIEAYSINVQKVLADNSINEKERKALRWIAAKLGLSESEVQQADLNVASKMFERAFGKACVDGIIDESEEATLVAIASSMGITIREMFSKYLNNSGEAFIRGILKKQIERGVFDENSWNGAVASAKRLGIHETEIKLAIEPQIEKYVEHVLADAKADDRLQDSERESIEWLLKTFRVSVNFRAYVESQLRQLQEYTDVLRGKLPSIEPIGVALRAGEIAHFQCQGKMRLEKQLKSGPRVDVHHGIGTITDNRFIFSSPTRSVEFVHRRVIDLIWSGDSFEIRSAGKGTGTYSFGSRSKLGAAIYQAAILMVNQTLIRQISEGSQRAIPRDVRQRVWQTYGGRCADCQSNQYLEFDHIIPVSKGGSNSDNNVQLLCRGCNLKKSDRI